MSKTLRADTLAKIIYHLSFNLATNLIINEKKTRDIYTV